MTTAAAGIHGIRIAPGTVHGFADPAAGCDLEDPGHHEREREAREAENDNDRMETGHAERIEDQVSDLEHREERDHVCGCNAEDLSLPELRGEPGEHFPDAPETCGTDVA